MYDKSAIGFATEMFNTSAYCCSRHAHYAAWRCVAAEMCDVKRRKEDWSSESDSSETESSGAPKRKKAKAVEKPKVESDDDKSSSSDDDDEAGVSDADDSDEEEEEEEESASDDADDFIPFGAGSDSDDGTRINNTSIFFHC